SVTLSLDVRERHADAVTVGFRIEDTGIGIEAERLPYIFDEFTQASYDIGLNYGGSGLGLTISRKLVELYGSSIEVESVPGKGTAFSFALRLRLPGS
ncbi:MAG TPA: ATP-binding protein, partial [Thermoanaerobaculia bacterium]|nr:ATP-binding protein [Thermoanaerobaculia bacterium]